MEIVVQVVAPADAEAGGRRRATPVGGLMKKLAADLKLRQDLIGDDPARFTKIHGADFAEHASTAAEGGPPAAPVLLHPYRQQQRGAVVADRVRAAGQEDAREK